MGLASATVQREGLWAREFVDLVRAASGGLLFGVPLLFTVEIMWTGQHTTPRQALAVLAVSILVLTVLNRTAGFRAVTDTTIRDSAIDAVEGVALAIVLVVAMLALLGEITSSTPLAVILGKSVYEVLPVCVGIGVANSILREQSSGDDTSDDEPASTEPATLNATVADLGASTIGAVFIALSIAPTDEVPMVTASRSPLWLLAIVAASLLFAYAIVFVAGFAGQSRRHAQPGLLQHPLIETLASYVVALLSAWAMLGIFQRADAPWRITLAHVIVLGLPAAIGGAAGRLAI